MRRTFDVESFPAAIYLFSVLEAFSFLLDYGLTAEKPTNDGNDPQVSPLPKNQQNQLIRLVPTSSLVQEIIQLSKLAATLKNKKVA